MSDASATAKEDLIPDAIFFLLNHNCQHLAGSVSALLDRESAALARIKTLEKILGTILPKLPYVYGGDGWVAFGLVEIGEWQAQLGHISTTDAQPQAATTPISDAGNFA